MKSPLKLFQFLLVCLVAGCSRQPPAPVPHTPPATMVKVALALGTNVPIRLQVPGRVSPCATVAVRSQVDGMVQHVHFHEGDLVRAGQLLFTVDPKPFETAVAQQKAMLDKDLALEKTAQSEQKMNGELLRSRVVSQENYDESASSAESLHSAVESDRANMDAAEIGLSNCYIRAPITGRAGLVQLPPGNLINGPDVVLVTLNQTDPIYVDLALPERQLPGIRRCLAVEHLTVEARIPGDPQAALFGELTAINNQIDSETGTILLRALFTNRDETLWPGQNVQTVLTLKTMTNAVTLPAQALRSDSQGAFVFVVSPDQRLERRPVELENAGEGQLPFVLGVGSGERVVIESHSVLAPGMQVQLNSP